MIMYMYQVFSHHDICHYNVDFALPQDFPPKIPPYCCISWVAKIDVPDWYASDIDGNNDNGIYLCGHDRNTNNPVAYIIDVTKDKLYNVKVLDYRQGSDVTA